MQFSLLHLINNRPWGVVRISVRYKAMSAVNKTPILKLNTLSKTLMAGALVLSVAACSEKLNTRGNLLDPERVVEIKPGEQSREDVAEILGSPSSITPFGSDTWYYIAKRTATFAFFEPKVTERQVLVVKFTKDGKVASVDTKGLEQSQTIQPVDRKTPTHGNKMTVLEQLIGNLGRFKQNNKKKKQNSENEIPGESGGTGTGY